MSWVYSHYPPVLLTIITEIIGQFYSAILKFVFNVLIFQTLNICFHWEICFYIFCFFTKLESFLKFSVLRWSMNCAHTCNVSINHVDHFAFMDNVLRIKGKNMANKKYENEYIIGKERRNRTENKRSDKVSWLGNLQNTT